MVFMPNLCHFITVFLSLTWLKNDGISVVKKIAAVMLFYFFVRVSRRKNTVKLAKSCG